MSDEANSGVEVTLVSGSKPGLDEDLTPEELEALDEFYRCIEEQGDISCLDEETLEILEKIWIVRKISGRSTPVHKSFLGDQIWKRK